MSLFDPETNRETIRLGLSDDVELGLLPQLLRHLSVAAPNMTVVIHRTNYLALSQQLSSGKITLGICYTGSLPAHAKRRTVRRSQSVMVRADRDIAPITLDQYCARPHALVSSTGDLTGFIDQALAGLGRSRQVKLSIPSFQGLSVVLSGTALIATVPDYAANALIANSSMRSEALPFPVPAFDLSMAWNLNQERDPLQKWLRRQVLECLGDRH